MCMLPTRIACHLIVECASKCYLKEWWIKVITKLPNSEQSYTGKIKTHNYINRQNQSTNGQHITHRRQNTCEC